MTVTTEQGRRPSWPINPAPRDYVLGHVRAVVDGAVLDDAWIAVREGRIAAVEPHPPGAGADVDGGGLLCLPGLVDVHSDALEHEARPRPTAQLPWDFALLSMEGKLLAAGITTVFHGARFERISPRGIEAEEVWPLVCAAVTERGDAPVDHRVLHRLDVRSPEGIDALRGRLDALVPGGPAPLVSHEDHTPGQGQYADRTQMEKYLVGKDGFSPDQAREHVTRLIADRDQLLDVREEALAWLRGLAVAGRIRLLGHDPASAEEVADLAERGGAVAEFPTTLAAAEAAREHGMPVVMGAPNVLRGRSHSGNVSALELVRHGLVDALASDYLPSGLLAGAWTLAAQGVVDLPEAVRLVTAGPAAVAGLTDRGRLAEGHRADLTLVDDSGTWPRAQTVFPARTG